MTASSLMVSALGSCAIVETGHHGFTQELYAAFFADRVNVIPGPTLIECDTVTLWQEAYYVHPLHPTGPKVAQRTAKWHWDAEKTRYQPRCKWLVSERVTTKCLHARREKTGISVWPSTRL